MSPAARALTIALALAASASLAHAQPAHENSTAFSIERLVPPVGAGAFFAAQDADVLPAGELALSATASLMARPIVLRDIIDGERATEPVSRRLGYDFAAGIGLGRRYQLGAALPLVAAQDGDRLRGIDLDETGLRPVTLGDLRLAGKARLVGHPGALGPGLGAALTVTLPTGDDDHFAGEAGPTVAWQLIGSYAGTWGRAAVNVGPRFRTERVVLLSPARAHDNELQAAIAGELLVPGLPLNALSVLAEYALVRGDASGQGDSRGPSPREARFGLRWRTAGGWSVTGGAGFGTSPAEVGSPAWRAVLAASWSSAPAGDLDGDGVPDRTDRCRLVAEDRDGFRDLDGCPDRDNDGDGIADPGDDCPLDAEDVDGVTDLDGCPES